MLHISIIYKIVNQLNHIEKSSVLFCKTSFFLKKEISAHIQQSVKLIFLNHLPQAHIDDTF